MLKQCEVCKEIFNYNFQPILCPHKQFPKACEIHNRIHCGQLECQTDYKAPKNNKVNFPLEKRA